MAQGQIVGSWIENGQACVAIAVDEGSRGRVEYIGRVPVDDAWQAMTAAQKKAALVAAAKAHRDQSLAPAPTDLGLTGSVAV